MQFLCSLFPPENGFRPRTVFARERFSPENGFVSLEWRSHAVNRFSPPYNLSWDFPLYDHAKELQGFGILVRIQSSTRRFQLRPSSQF